MNNKLSRKSRQFPRGSTPWRPAFCVADTPVTRGIKSLVTPKGIPLWKPQLRSGSPGAEAWGILRNQPIGIFDSGLGGLTVYKAVKKLLPQETFIYLADQKNCPYGRKNKSKIIKLAFKNTSFLIKKQCKLIVVACNTATVVAIDALRQKFPATFFVGVVPPVKLAVKISKTGHFAILSTPATQKSNHLDNLIKKFAQGKTVYNLSCPALVKIIENGQLKKSKTTSLLKKCLKKALKDKKVDTLVSGCTHFPLAKNYLKKLLPQIHFIQPGPAVAKQVKRILTKEKMLAAKKKQQ